MPAAIVRAQVKDLPMSVTLNDSQAMMDEVRLSRFDSVDVGARVSKSGTASAKPGDLEGIQTGVSTRGSEIEIVINREI